MRALILTLATCSLLGAQNTAALAARVQKLEDVNEIRTVLTDYGRLLDARDLIGYSKLFAKDGEWVGGFGSAKGPAGILEFMQKNLGTAPNRANNYHILSNFEIDVQGDTATAWSRWAFIVPAADGKPSLAQGGLYHDKLIRENGAWKFLRREAFNDLPAGGPQDGKAKGK
jgi:ketosteroid isomerase-like protein